MKFFIFLIVFFRCFYEAIEIPEVPKSEIEALQSFFFSTNGPFWVKNDGWDIFLNSSAPMTNPCDLSSTWFGIECIYIENITSHISTISLMQNKLSSSYFPSKALSNLTQLIQLDLSSLIDSKSHNENMLYGSIQEICHLNSNLQVLSLSNNYLYGEFPSCIGHALSNLSYINFAYNQINGTTPSSICSLSSLITFDMKETSMTGSIPKCIGNQLSELKLLNYENINSGGISLTGGIPNTLCNLKKLETLNLGHSHIGGSIPECFGMNQTNLKIFHAHNSNIKSYLPLSLCSATNLESISLYGNAIKGTLPTCIGSELLQLRNINIYASSIVSTIPEEFCKLSKLNNLNLNENYLYGSLPTCFGALQSELVVLNLFQNHMNGTISENICLLKNIVSIELWGNSFSGRLPTCISQLKKLNYIDIAYNQFYGNILSNLCHLTSLSTLYIHNNSFTGVIPTCIGSLNLLSDLRLDNNFLISSIPDSICNATSLLSINISSNLLTGSIPTCIGNNISFLQVFDISHNKINGKLPSSLCQLSYLTDIMIYDNSIKSKIPSCYGYSFPVLERFFIQNNHIYGSLPLIWSLPQLKVLVFSNNKLLKGEISQSLFQPGVNLSSSYLSLQQTQKLEFLKDDEVDVSYTNDKNNENEMEHMALNALEYLVIEGTSITGTIPSTLCLSYQLKSLLLSGNLLTGKIPKCITHLKKLETIRVTSNQFTGSIHNEISNMSSLKNIDFSNNKFSGHLPKAIGEISNQLIETKFNLNYLSCNLPKSILNWNTSSSSSSNNNNDNNNNNNDDDDNNKFKTLDILNGNLFSCPQKSIFSIQMKTPQSKKFTKAEGDYVNYYSCGGSAYVLPIVIPCCSIIILLFIYFIGIKLKLGGFKKHSSSTSTSTTSSTLTSSSSSSSYMSLKKEEERQKVYDNNNNDFYYYNNRIFQKENDINIVYLEMNRIANSIIFIGICALLFMIPITTYVVKSSYSCQYTARITIGGKKENKVKFSIYISIIVTICIFTGVYVWLRYLYIYIIKNSNIIQFCLNYNHIKNKNNKNIIKNKNQEEGEGVGRTRSSNLSIYFGSQFHSFSNNSFNVGLDPLRKLLLDYSDYSEDSNEKDSNEHGHSSRTTSTQSLLLSPQQSMFGKTSTELNQPTLLDLNGSIENIDQNIIQNHHSQDVERDPLNSVIDPLSPCHLSEGDNNNNNNHNTNNNSHHSLLIKKYDKEEDEEGGDKNKNKNNSIIKGLKQSKKSKKSKLNVQYHHEPSVWYIKLIQSFLLFSFMAIIVIGPNIAYVYITLGSYSYHIKLFCTLAIACFKSFMSASLLPKSTKLISSIFFPHIMSSLSRFRMTINLCIFLSIISLILVPIIIVIITDERCMLNYFQPEDKITRLIPYEKCYITSSESGCLQHGINYVESSYIPKFHYRQGQCISALISTYAPVFLAYILLSAPISAALELIIVPLIAPWCYHHKKKSKIASWLYYLLLQVTLNVPCVLCSYFNNQKDINELLLYHDFIIPINNNDNDDNNDDDNDEAQTNHANIHNQNHQLGPSNQLHQLHKANHRQTNQQQYVNHMNHINQRCQSIIRRGYVRFCTTLMIVLTYGMAAPLIGTACIISELIQFNHHTLILSQMIDLSELLPQPKLPELNHCLYLPKFSGFIILLTTLIFWFCVIIYYMRSEIIIILFFITFIFLNIILFIMLYRKEKRKVEKEINFYSHS